MNKASIHGFKEKGKEEAAKYLLYINKYKQLAIEDVDICSGMSKQEFYNALHLTNKLKEKCVMTHKSIVVKWNMYYSGICCLCQQGLLVDDLSRQEPYPPEQRKAMVDLFAALEKRGLLQTTTRIKHILTSKGLDILASAIWLIDISPMDQMSIALLIPLLKHTRLHPSKVLPSMSNPTRALEALDDLEDENVGSKESNVKLRSGPLMPPALATSPATLPQAHIPVAEETSVVFTWEDPNIVYKGLRPSTQELWFKVTIWWKHGKNCQPGKFIPTSARALSFRAEGSNDGYVCNTGEVQLTVDHHLDQTLLLPYSILALSTMAKGKGSSAAAKVKNKQQAEAVAKACKGQTVSTQNIVWPYALYTSLNFQGILNYMVTWASTFYNCLHKEALERLKHGKDAGGVPMLVLQLAFIDYAIHDEREIHSKLIKEKGAEEALNYLVDINRYKDLAIRDLDV